MELVADFEVGTTSDTLLDRDAFDALVLIQAGVAKLRNANLDTRNVHTALELIESVESMGRQLDAAQNHMLESIDRTGVHAIDGHGTAKTMVAHMGKLSSAEANARRQTMRALAALPTVRNVYEDGLISSCMVKRLGRTYANPRIRDLAIDADAWFAEHALNDTYEFFDLVVSNWERLADDDGAESKDARAERDRNHRMTQNDDGKWEWEGSCAAYDGAITKDIFDAFEKIEFDIDWQWALDNHGPDANPTHMPRTAAQRRADAFAKVHIYAAKGLEADGGPTITTDIVIDNETFERETLKLLGADVEPRDPLGVLAAGQKASSSEARYDDPRREDFVCRTLNGARLSPRSAVAHALLGHLRRAVIGADSVVIDLGRRRLYTGYARLAAQLQNHECYWPGCHVPATSCQIDHLTPHSDRSNDPAAPDPGGGLTNSHNAGPACGKHNRHKENGYTVTRLSDGTIEIRRPDGTILR
ncbi:MAG: HNH endonuclease [Acidimicrobiales bacterium]|nr:MAG: HNH endonuclease [Acidimicrobiales bacterium]